MYKRTRSVTDTTPTVNVYVWAYSGRTNPAHLTLYAVLLAKEVDGVPAVACEKSTVCSSVRMATALVKSEASKYVAISPPDLANDAEMVLEAAVDLAV
jgi:hypothetical protein